MHLTVPLEPVEPSWAVLRRRRLFLGQPGGWSTPTTALCARRAGALSRRKEGPLPSQSTSTRARARRGPKNRLPSATMEPRSSLAARFARRAVADARRRARPPARARSQAKACAVHMCRRGGGLPGCFLLSAWRACFVGSPGARARARHCQRSFPLCGSSARGWFGLLPTSGGS